MVFRFGSSGRLLQIWSFPMAGLTPKRRRRKVNPDAPLIAENQRLKRETQRLAEKLRQAETIIEVQKNSRRYWGFPCRRPTTAGARHEGHRRTFPADRHGRSLFWRSYELIRLTEEGLLPMAPTTRILDYGCGSAIPHTVIMCGMSWNFTPDHLRDLVVLVVPSPVEFEHTHLCRNLRRKDKRHESCDAHPHGPASDFARLAARR
jgi:hypothetical protein